MIKYSSPPAGILSTLVILEFLSVPIPKKLKKIFTSTRKCDYYFVQYSLKGI